MNELSCQYFDKNFSAIKSNHSWNDKDSQGSKLLKILFMCILFFFIFLITIIVNFFILNTRSKKKQRPFLKYGIISFIISFFCAMYIYISFKKDPLNVVYMISSVITSVVNTPPVLDPYSYFSGAHEFELNYKTIQSEIKSLNKNIFTLTRNTFGGTNSEIGKDIHYDKNGEEVGWKIFTVSIGDQISKEANENCPTLVDLIRKYNHQIKSCVISVLPPKTKIPQHVGYYKGLLRYMMGIEIPKNKEAVFLCANDNKVLWDNGKSIMFDDCYPHKVFNLSNEKRIVLYIDIIRPLKSDILNKINEYVIKKMQNHPTVLNEIKKTEKHETV